MRWKRKVCECVVLLGLAVPAMGQAAAADLSQDCCADLEERIAELEATTAQQPLHLFGEIG